VLIKRLAIHHIGDENLARAKGGIDLSQREHNLITVRAGRHQVIGESDSVKFFPQWRTQRRENVGEACA